MHERRVPILKPSKKERLHEFSSINRSEFAKQDDKALAVWQSEYEPGSPQYILAEHEWQRRLTAQQVQATRFAAWVALVGVVVGALLGAYLTDLAKDRPKELPSNQGNAAAKTGIEQPKLAPKPEPANVIPAKQQPNSQK